MFVKEYARKILANYPGIHNYVITESRKDEFYVRCRRTYVLNKG